MATLKSTASVLASSFEDVNPAVNSDKRPNLLKSNHQTAATLPDLVRHFDLSTFDRLMSAALSADQPPPNWSKEMSELLHSTELQKMIMTNDALQANLNGELRTGELRNGRKSSRGSEGDPRSSVSDFEEIDEEMINEEQSAFLAGASISPFPSIASFSNQSTVNQMVTVNQTPISNQNVIQENSPDNSNSESNDRSTINSFTFNQDSKSGNEDADDAPAASKTNRQTAGKSSGKPSGKSSGKRKSSSRLARQTGDGPAKKYSCHLCEFVTENKPQYNVHMDKHYEHRCTKCGYGCRTKGRLNRHIRESHPELADQLGCGDSKRKKGNLNRRASAKSNYCKPMDCSMDLSDAGSDSTILVYHASAVSNDSPAPKQTASSPQQERQSISPTIFKERTGTRKTKATELNEAEPDRASSHSASDDEAGLMMPNDPANVTRYRKYYCKKCRHVTTSKRESWQHNKVHIAKDKILKCPHCDFTTGFKHHFEYHLRSFHFKSKPYKCIKCTYQCINKSMLASHLKSHSNIYQYRCNDCAYATKYCHSLKLHLRKYQHKPDKVLNLDGSENPYPIIDVYGTRRGPRPKKGVGSLKLVKRVLEDNDHVVVDKAKVEQIVNTLAEQNPEDGDEKLFRLMMSNEEREVRVDQQLNHIIGEQLKTNASNQLSEADLANSHPIGSSIKQILSQQQTNKHPGKALSKSLNLSSSSSSPAQAALQFAKEKAAGCSPATLNRLSNFCKSPKTKTESKGDSAERQRAENRTAASVPKQRPPSNLLTGADPNNNCLTSALARSLLNPSLLSGSASLLNPASLPTASGLLSGNLLNGSLLNGSLLNGSLLNGNLLNGNGLNLLNGNLLNESETASLNPLESIGNYPAHLLTNQLLHGHLLAQSSKSAEQSKAQLNELNSANTMAASNFIAQLAFHLALSDQQQIQQQQQIQRQPNANPLNLLLSTLSSSQPSLQTAANLQTATNQLLNQSAMSQLSQLNQNLLNSANLFSSNLINQNLLNQNLSNSPIRPSNQSLSSPPCGQPAADVLSNLENATSNAKGLTNSMIAKWHSYLTSLLLNKAANNSSNHTNSPQKAPTSLFSNVANAGNLANNPMLSSGLSSGLSNSLSNSLSSSQSGSTALSNVVSSIVHSSARITPTAASSVGQTASSPDNHLSAGVTLSSATAGHHKGSQLRANSFDQPSSVKATNGNHMLGQRKEEASSSSKSRASSAKVENQSRQQPPKSNVANVTNSSLQAPDLSSVLSSIGQVFASSASATSCPATSSSAPVSSSLPSQSCELDLSAILGYSMLMQMQQFSAQNPNKIKQENS